MRRPIRCIFFDCDNTLYPESSGLMHAIGGRMNRFMIERLNVNPAEVSKVRDDFLKKYGTTLNALRRFHLIDPEEFLDFVHDIPLQQHLHYDPELDRMLERIHLKKIVFTNADAGHARRVLRRLGILRHFEYIIDIHLIDFCNKPDPRAYAKAMALASVQPEECMLIEDSLVNAIAASELGITTVLVGAGLHSHRVHHHIDRITELEVLLKKL